MIRKALFCLAILATSTLAAQETTEQDHINKDVWYNFMQAYQDLDAMLFNQIHTDDVLRVAVDGDKIYVGKEYKDRNLEVFNNWNAQRINQVIEFSFISRVQKGDYAYEIGIYKLTRKKGFRSDSYYGKFNVTLQKINGVWKIKMDSDTSEGDTINEDDFNAGSILNY